ncbi:helix-turn-helix domain-containing protein [Salinibaculum salinum]|uniref:helix-turn-helix domain-containing protein n=1 Tax=Salinibaculum salinum TaxID=3131996 RepID=UPI0030EB158A
MKHVRVRITAEGREDEIHPMYDVMMNAPFVERGTALQWNFTGDALGILHYIEGDADAYAEVAAEVPEVLGFDIVDTGEDAFYAYIRDATTDALQDLFGPMTTGGLLVVPPIVYHEDGTVTLSLFGPTDEMQDAIEAVPPSIDVTIEEVGGLAATRPAVEARLSDRQRDAITTALELGYYEIPREVSHEDVAEAIGCAPSTAAEHLRKAESKVLRDVFL